MNRRNTTIWVRLPFLPIELHSPKILIDIGNLIGTTVALDARNSANLQAVFARICIEVNLSANLPSEIWINNRRQEVIFENSVFFDSHCSPFPPAANPSNPINVSPDSSVQNQSENFPSSKTFKNSKHVSSINHSIHAKGIKAINDLHQGFKSIKGSEIINLEKEKNLFNSSTDLVTNQNCINSHFLHSPSLNGGCSDPLAGSFISPNLDGCTSPNPPLLTPPHHSLNFNSRHLNMSIMSNPVTPSPPSVSECHHCPDETTPINLLADKNLIKKKFCNTSPSPVNDTSSVLFLPSTSIATKNKRK